MIDFSSSLACFAHAGQHAKDYLFVHASPWELPSRVALHHAITSKVRSDGLTRLRSLSSPLRRHNLTSVDLKARFGGTTTQARFGDGSTT
jgi:hypothetical protein